MSDPLVRYGQDDFAVAVIEACRQRGLFALLDLDEPRERRSLSEQLEVSEARAGVALQILESLGWIERHGNDAFRRTAASTEWLAADGRTWTPAGESALNAAIEETAGPLFRSMQELLFADREALDLNHDLEGLSRLVILAGHAESEAVASQHAGWLRLLADETSMTADAFVVTAASAGLFNESIPERFPRSSQPCRFSLHDLTRRDYVIRHAAEDDLDRLCELEELCWQHTRTPRELIHARLQKYPQGQLVLEKDGEVLGVIYSQRIADTNALMTQTAATVHELHDESGPIVQLLAVNIDPRAQSASYGDQLLELMLQRCGLMTGVEQVVGVTLCKNYDVANGMSLDDYIRREGISQDPVLAFHHVHGADVVKVIPGYRPEDVANLTNGVLVSYDIVHRRPRRRATDTATPAKTRQLDEHQIARFVRREAALLIAVEEAALDNDRPVMEMGLDSADLLKLQRLCEEEFGLALQSGFFFQYNSIQKVVNHLAGILAPAPIAAEAIAISLDQPMPVARDGAESDVAIIGMSCKLPGGIETPADFWRVLSTNECVIGEFPRKRRSWPAGAEYAGIDRGGFVEDVDAFDAQFFRISPAEAQIIDPQQRMLMELAWACFEDAGIPPVELKGSNAGVFVGASNADYSRLIDEAGIEIEAHHGVGSSLAILANRISYFFDFSGPSLLIDTACSSSLVALHTAVQSLRSGECATALVGGVNLICHPNVSLAYHKAGMLAPDGLCKVFDAKANGYVRAEGAVVLLLKPLRAAIADGNQIHAVIRGSATNHGGLGGGLTVPNPQKQKELLIAAWKDAGIASQDLTYIEAHGTGTSLGDPIEVQGIQAAHAELTAPDRPETRCGIGSVKSNVGHLESAAGVTGLLKIILAFRNQQLPASIHFSRLNPKIHLDATPLYVHEQLRAWSSASPRVAAVSSFGSGGTNAHVVVQEYEAGAREESRDDHHLFVLSAATEDRLRASADRVVQWLEREANAANFADAIYTWQVGRTALSHRLAIRATDPVDLLHKVKQWLDGKDVAECWSGELAQKWSSVNRVWQTKSGRQLLDQACLEGDLELAGTLWVAGIDIDWRAIHAAKRGGTRKAAILSLPTYPFAKERYWIDAAAVTRTIASVTTTSIIHPLLHDNTSDLSEQRFTTRFSGDEFFLSNHMVRGVKVLPGVCQLEMARAAIAASAGERAGAIRLKDVVWTTPVVVDEPKQIHTAVFIDEQGEIAYEIYGEPIGEDRIVHSQGRVSFAATTDSSIDIESLKQRAGKQIDGSRCREAWSAAEIEHGPALRGIERLWLGHDASNQRYVLAEVTLPRAVAATNEQYLLHPSVMDSAFQATVALSLESGAKAGLPFAIEEIEIHHRTPARSFVSIRERADRLQKQDIDICDEQGRVCVRLRGFTTRPLPRDIESAASQNEAAIELTSFVPRWEPTIPSHGEQWPSMQAHVLLVGGTVEQQQAIRTRYTRVTVLDATDEIHDGAAIDHVIWLTPASSAFEVTDERLITEQSHGVLRGLRLIQSLLRQGYATRELGWTVVTWETQPITHDDRVRSAHAGVHGLIGALAKEYSHWSIRLVDLPATGEWPLDEILNLPADDRGDAWAYRAGEWYRQQLLRYEPSAATSSAWRRGGVHVVIGGAGGLGEAFSEHLIREAGAQLIWIGRRELDPEIQSKIDRLGKLGPAPHYLSADATDLDSLTQACRTIKARHGEIHGVVHAAIVLLDKSLAQMDEARFEAGLAAKVNVAVRMAQVFASEPLDFVLFFSSLLSFAKPAGQSNYLAGSTFEDAYAHQLQQAWACPVKVMNWGYWGSKGIVASDAYRARMAQNGFASIEPAEGMVALEQLLSAPVSQLALFKGDSRGLAGLPVTREHVTVAAAQSPKVTEQLTPRTTRALLPEQLEQHVDQVAELQRLMKQLSFAQLHAISFETTPMYRRWLEESRRVLEGVDGVHDAAALWAEWDARLVEWQQNANLRAHVQLVDATLRALPEILTGRRPATDIMFPNASVALVEGIYKHHHVADHFNAVAADVVAEFVEARLKLDRNARIRIIEFGAGTGGTSDGMFKRLQPHARSIAEYCYTDISKAFLMHAEETYGPTTPYLTYRLLNVERPLAAQGLELGSYDLAIATNVLHATRNIRNTLRNAKATLKHNGVLILNELLGNSLFMHLTFGLLEGWWLSEDAALRTPGTPLLAPESWQRVLEGEGFQDVLFPARATHAQGQQIIVGTSDGVIRQQREERRETLPSPAVRRESVSTPQRPIAVATGNVDAVNLRERAATAFKKVVGATLRLSVQQIDSREELEQYGIDSILIVKMVNALNGVFSGVTSTLFFEHRTIDALVDHFLETEKDAVLRWVGVTEPAAEAIPSSIDPSASEPTPVSTQRRQRARSRNAAAIETPSIPAERVQDIAIVGLSGRYPQSIDIDAFWDNLREGKDCIVEVPKERWDWRRYFSEDRSENGRHFSKLGGFIDGVDEFDPLFFNILPRDAKYIDPQERLFLQHAWMAVEDAGYTRATLQVPDKHDLAGQAGVYVGVMYSEYQLLAAEGRVEDVRMGFAGNLASIANRVSYALNVHGPSMTVDTMCSSSLTAIHVACQDLKLGRTSLAIAGGVNVSVHHNKYRMLSAGQFIAADGRCQAFGEGGDGFIPAEGVGVVVLKRLGDAERDGDHIYGVIRGSAVNHGGKTNGYTVPNPQAQAAAVGRALLEANLDARHVSYIEAHGTGTKLGDPIEIAALTKAFGQSTKDTGFCLVGSVKSNIGHCESAAGVAGLTKVLLQMQHQQIVPSLHAAQLNPYIDFDSTPFVVNRSLRTWERPVIDGHTAPRIAGISSFGAGGSNAHLIVEEQQRSARTEIAAGNHAIVLSARTPEQLKQRAVDLLAFLRSRQTIELASVAYTLQVGREAMDERFGFVARSIEQAIEKLHAYVRGEQAIDEAFEGQVRRNKEALALFSSDADLQQTVAKWVADRKLARLVELWVKGLELDWNQLHDEARPRRISLPTYPFAKDRHWIDVAVAEAQAEVVVTTATLHPLLHRNTSDLHEQRFSSTFTGGESFLRDRVLPAVAHLEMARAAIELALPERNDSLLQVSEVAFGPPIVVDGETNVRISLWSAGEEVEFEIDCGGVIHCQGSALATVDAPPHALDVEQLVRQGARVERLRLSSSGPELVAWIRPASDGNDTVDVDLCDERGNAIVRARGVMWPGDVAESAIETPMVESPIVDTVIESAPIAEAPQLSMPVSRKELIFLAAAPTAAVQPERKKRVPTALSAPGATAPVTASAAKARITLAAAGSSNAVTTTPVASPVRLYECGSGIYAIEMNSSRSNDVIDHLLQALDRAQQDPSLKVLILGGVEHCFVTAGRARYNEAIDRKLFQRLVSFDHPVIATLPGDVIGAGFLTAALCDFIVCSESAEYGYAAAEQQFLPTLAEASLFDERFGVGLARELLFASQYSTGAQLRAKGWTCPVLPWDEVEGYALQLAASLAQKTQDSLRLLKRHSNRRLVELVDALTRVENTKVSASGDVAIVRVGRAGLQHAIANDSGAIVMLIEDADVPDSVVADVRLLILESKVPCVAALPGDAKDNAWLAAQFCDAGVYSRSGVYSAQGLPSNASPFLARFGEAANEILLSGAEYSGSELQRRIGALLVADADDVLSMAMRVATSFAQASPEIVTAWRRQIASLQSDPTAPIDDETDAAIPASISLRSKVVTATVRPNGVVVVKMEDRDAKNMFSDALLEGIREVFAHIERTPAYKVVLLTGYDSYFSSGGTKQNLLAIQSGGIRFTDLEIFRAALDCRLPVIAAMQGHGIGAGWSMGMFADVVLLSEESRYVSPYMSYGFTPGAGATYVLPAKLGLDLARESLFTAQHYSGAELKQRGTTLRIVPRANLFAEALSLADQMARASRGQLIALKQQLSAEVRERLDETIPLELVMHETTFVGRSDTRARIENSFREESEASSPLPSGILSGGNTSAADSSTASHESSIAQSSGDISATLRTLLANELQVPESEMAEHVQFVDLGLDSINAVTWIRKINAKYQTSIEATKVYAYPTLAQLSRYVKEEAEKRGTLPRPEPAPPMLPIAKTPPAPIAQSEVHTTTQKLTSRRRDRGTRDATAATRGPEPIAIIGMAGRFPQAKNIDELWQNIATGRNCIAQVPPERWDLREYYREGEPKAGKTYSQWAGMIDDHDRFDPLFFNISPAEAETMDPQQRLFLQTCWHGIENAGYDATRLSGSKCGVFVGCTAGDYQHLAPEQSLSAQGFTGNAMSILAARIAYFLDLQGPCVSIDTACSSSLVAIAQACDSLSWGGSDLALAGGVYVMSAPEMHIKTSQAAMLSPDGRCYTFDQRANGFVPGEGVGVVLLKRLSDAERDGDIIHAVIEGWGVNQDGKTNGITAPNPESQTRLEQDVYDRHGIDPAGIQLIEAHGTGTKLGDPIEVEGLKAAFAKYTRNTGYCALGSVKSNIGHCLTAAGIAGTLKLALALQHRQLPPTINFDRLNEHIDLGDSPFYVNDRLQEWTLDGATRRRSAISSFGFSGTNAHLVIAEHVPQAEAESSAPVRVIVPLSARTPEQLRQLAIDLLAFVREANSSLAEIAYTLQVGRAAMEERLGIVAGSAEELVVKLTAWLNGDKNRDDIRQGQVRRNEATLGILSEDEDVKEAILDKWIASGKLSKLAEYWVRGLAFDWNRLYGTVKPRRVVLPVYPFARERYWIEARPRTAQRIASGSALHPLLQRNTSDLQETRYSSTLTGEEFFLRDHRIRADKVLPGVAYLEMAHAAIARTWPKQSESDAIELHDVVWLKPVIVAEPREVSISLFPTDDGGIDYEIHSLDVHCQGRARFSARAAAKKLDVEQLRRRMDLDRLDAADLYPMFDAMGLHYGTAHQGVDAIHVGANELLAQLRLPSALDTDRLDYALHPSVMDSALQASIGLLADRARIPDQPLVPFAVEQLRVLSPCTREMTAWIRFADGSRAGDRNVKLDLELCDERGTVCIEMRGLSIRVLRAEAETAEFDEAFFERLLSDVVSGDVSIDEAVQLS